MLRNRLGIGIRVLEFLGMGMREFRILATGIWREIHFIFHQYKGTQKKRLIQLHFVTIKREKGNIGTHKRHTHEQRERERERLWELKTIEYC